MGPVCMKQLETSLPPNFKSYTVPPTTVTFPCHYICICIQQFISNHLSCSDNSITTDLLKHVKNSACHKDIESTGHLSLTADQKFIWDQKSVTCQEFGIYWLGVQESRLIRPLLYDKNVEISVKSLKQINKKFCIHYS